MTQPTSPTLPAGLDTKQNAAAIELTQGFGHDLSTTAANCAKTASVAQMNLELPFCLTSFLVNGLGYNALSTVGVAQSVEHRTVAPTVAGSIPVSHPNVSTLRLHRYFP
jgi:hypothetical protein